MDVPPVPWRRIGLWSLPALLVLGAAAAVIVPAIEEDKRENNRREAAGRRAFVEREQRRLAREQRVRRAPFEASSPAGAAPALERAIGADTRRRVAAGELKGPVRRVTCEPSTPGDVAPSAASGTFKCVVVRRSIEGERGVRASVGHPFVARVDYRRRRMAWCKTNPRAGEKAGGSLTSVPLSPACAGRLRAIL